MCLEVPTIPYNLFIHVYDFMTQLPSAEGQLPGSCTRVTFIYPVCQAIWQSQNMSDVFWVNTDEWNHMTGPKK